MKELVGNLYSSDIIPKKLFFVMYHPCVMLYAEHDLKLKQELKRETWNHLQKLKEIINE